MKKKNALLALSGLALAGGLAWRYTSRPRDIRWIDYAGELHHAMASNFAVVDGVRLHYQEKGDRANEAIVLLHGFCSSNFTWKDQLGVLAEAGYRAIAPDLKGFGFSEKPADKRYHIQDQAQLMVGLLDQLGIDRATFVGNSYGAGTALACALMWPERVKRLVLVDAAFNDEPLKQFPFSVYLSLARTWGVGEVTAPLLLGSKGLIKTGLADMFFDQSSLTKERVRAYFRPVRSINCQHAILMTARQWDLNWIESELASVTVPTCVIWGEYDRVIPVALGGTLHLGVPGSEFVVIPDCGHLPQEERPEETTALILDFLSRTGGVPVYDNGLGHREVVSSLRYATFGDDDDE